MYQHTQKFSWLIVAHLNDRPWMTTPSTDTSPFVGLPHLPCGGGGFAFQWSEWWPARVKSLLKNQQPTQVGQEPTERAPQALTLRECLVDLFSPEWCQTGEPARPVNPSTFPLHLGPFSDSKDSRKIEFITLSNTADPSDFTLQ